MNFSNTKMLRKLLSLIFVLSMIATLFTGCFGKGKDDSEPSTEPDININLAETTESTAAPTQPTVTEPPVINENMATVLSQLTIRSSPSTDATVVGTLYAGDKVEVSRRETVTGIEWAYIISPDAGWICMDFVEMDFEPDAPAENNTNTPAGETTPTESKPDNNTNTNTGTTTNIKGVITAGELMIRSEGSTSGKVLGSYKKGEVITVLELKNGWGRTNKGWVKMEYVNTSGNTNTNNDKDDNNKDNNTKPDITGNGSTTVQFRGIVTAKELNIRSNASQSSDRVGSYTYGDRVEFLEKDGSWGRTNKGWISLNYVYQDGTTGDKTVSGVVTADGLNVRSGPGKNYDFVGSYNEDDNVTILAQFTYGNTTWGCTKKGWISMAYVDVDGEDDNDDSNNDDSDEAVTGIITADGLRIRSGPGTEYETVGSLEEGDEITILDQKKDEDGNTWGRIKEGWISMKYVELD